MCSYEEQKRMAGALVKSVPEIKFERNRVWMFINGCSHCSCIDSGTVADISTELHRLKTCGHLSTELRFGEPKREAA